MIEKVLVSTSMAVIAVGLAAPASANPVQKHHTVQDFFAAVQEAGIIGMGPAILANGYNVCWELWDQDSPGSQVAAGMQRDDPSLTFDEAAHFVIAAYENLCPVPGRYDWWAYSTS